MSIGLDLIALERKRQLEVHNWTPEHDAVHDEEEIALAAMYYACPKSIIFLVESLWPKNWDLHYAQKGESTRIRDLEKAGALIAAEIDRLKRL